VYPKCEEQPNVITYSRIQTPRYPRGTPQTLIRDPHLRLQIHTQKQTKILQLLRTEVYSSSEILALVLGLNHRQSVHKLLMTMQEQGLIRYAKVPVIGGHQNLWKITEHGQALAYHPSNNEMPSAKDVCTCGSLNGLSWFLAIVICFLALPVGLFYASLALFILFLGLFPKIVSGSMASSFSNFNRTRSNVNPAVKPTMRADGNTMPIF